VWIDKTRFTTHQSQYSSSHASSQYPFVEKLRELEEHGTQACQRTPPSYVESDEESFASELDLSVPHDPDEQLQEQLVQV
jgi:hypothetical protein